jgi:type II secretion system protein G
MSLFNKPRGFTLIELLIVVAIIAILAAIAIPNFLEAQTRSKVARVKADIRTVATGLESYRVDNNRYPLDTRDSGPDDGGIDFTFWFATPMTTPIAYLTSYPKDPFWTMGPDKYFQYGATKSKWIVASVGPDLDSPDRGDIKERLDFPETLYDFTLLELKFYDPTNGTISDGDVVRTSIR